MSDIQSRIAQRVQQAVERDGDQNEVVAGGGDFTPPPAGKAKARLIGYIETGPQLNPKFPAKKATNGFQLVFALYGKNKDGESWTRDDGKPMHILSRTYSVGRSEKSNAVKLFRQMCPKKDAQHFLGLLGRAFWVEVEHDTQPSKTAGKPDVTFANIKEAELKPAVREVLDEEDNVVGYQEIAVPVPADDEYRILEWHVPSKEDFDLLTERQQKKLKSSPEWAGSAWEALCGAGNPAAAGAPSDDDDHPEDDGEGNQAPKEHKPVDSVNVDADQLPSL